MKIKPLLYSWLSLITCLGVLLLCAVINFHFDPYHLFKPGPEAALRNRLLAGEPAQAAMPYNTRRLYRQVIQGSSSAPQVVLFGSARTARMSSKEVGGRSFFNHSLPRATLEDYLAIDQLYRQKALMPKTLIIALEPYQWNADNDFRGWKILEEEYYARATELGIDPNLQPFKNDRVTVGNRYKSLISASTLRASWQVWKDRQYWNRNGWDRVQLQPDGSLYDPNPAAREALDEEEASQSKGFEHFTRLNPRAQRAFEKWVTELRARRIRVILLLLPYSNDFLSHAAAKQWDHPITESEKYLYQFAGDRQIEIYGHYQEHLAAPHTLLLPAFRHD